MSDNPKHSDEKDLFSELIQKKLENHQMPVDESIWKGIEQRMAPSRKRLIPPAWYWISGSVAAALALLLILKPFTPRETTPSLSEVQQSQMKLNETISGQTLPAAETVQNISSLVAEQTSDVKKQSPTFGQKSKTKSSSVKQSLIAGQISPEVPVSEGNQLTDKLIENIITEEKAVGQKTAEETNHPEGTNNRTNEITTLPDLNDYPEVPEGKKKTRRKQPLLLAAAIGTEGSLSSGQDALLTDGYMRSPNLVKSEIASNYATVLEANDYSDARYYPPLSVGVTVAKPLTRIFSLESGLVYTYLRSDYTRPGITNYHGVLQLHYLGIPLNMRARLLDAPKWNLYVSAGTMLEKGLRSIYEQVIDDELAAATTNTDVKSGIDGVQWSLNGGVGVDYKIQKDLSLFLEPKLTYYLDNNQPMSARTEQPLTLGVSGGVRIEL